MNINKHISIFFKNLANGIVLDNAYDIYMRNQYIDYVYNKNINYIWSQDIDMNMISFFPDIEFLTVPQDAENIQALYNLKKLKGIEISARCLDELDLSQFNNLEYLLVIEKPKKMNNLEGCKNLKHLYCSQWKILDIDDLKCLNSLESLTLQFCERLQSLKGIEYFIHLKELKIEYCLKLRRINDLKEIKGSLKRLTLEDCNKIEDLNTIELLYELEWLHLFSFQTRVINKFPSLKFVNQMPHLKNFLTDYKIGDGDLTPLLKVENVDILNFYPYYNLKEDAFGK